MSPHSCHLPGCKTACPPAHLMCAKHWRMVENDTQREVYATVGRRSKSSVNATWAPWWRAQATAIDEVLAKVYPQERVKRERLLAKEMRFADHLEGKEASQ